MQITSKMSCFPGLEFSRMEITLPLGINTVSALLECNVRILSRIHRFQEIVTEVRNGEHNSPHFFLCWCLLSHLAVQPSGISSVHSHTLNFLFSAFHSVSNQITISPNSACKNTWYKPALLHDAISFPRKP